MQRIKLGSIWPWLVMAAVLVVAALELHAQGRFWFCACGHIRFWTAAVWSEENSQQFLDPYTFTHILHGIVFCGILALAARRLSPAWRLCIAVGLEAAWEVVENSAFIINRYREATAALGYTGDTVLNSLGDIVACGIGFTIAYRLGWRWSLVWFIASEVILFFWIHDGLILNIIMLIHPVDAIKAWQVGH